MTVLTCALHGTAFNYGCPGCNAADDWKIAGEVAERERDSEMCPSDEHIWVELEADVSECSVCKRIEFKAPTMEQLRRHLLGDEQNTGTEPVE